MNVCTAADEGNAYKYWSMGSGRVSAIPDARRAIARSTDPQPLGYAASGPTYVLDLLDPAEINKRASIQPPSGDEFENVLVVNGATASKQALVMSMNVKEMMKFKKTFLRKLRTETEGDRDDWERFVVIKVDAREGMSMYPRLLPGATVLIDRHYNSLKPYRKGESNMYAVSKNGSCTVKYVELAGRHLVLRPHNHAYPVEVMAMEEGKSAADYLIGRICYVGIET